MKLIESVRTREEVSVKLEELTKSQMVAIIGGGHWEWRLIEGKRALVWVW